MVLNASFQQPNLCTLCGKNVQLQSHNSEKFEASHQHNSRIIDNDHRCSINNNDIPLMHISACDPCVTNNITNISRKNRQRWLSSHTVTECFRGTCIGAIKGPNPSDGKTIFLANIPRHRSATQSRRSRLRNDKQTKKVFEGRQRRMKPQQKQQQQQRQQQQQQRRRRR